MQNSMSMFDETQLQNMLTLSAWDLPARILVSAVAAPEYLANNQDSSLTEYELFALLDHYMYSLKIARRYLKADLNTYSCSFPTAGIMQNGRCYRAPILAFNRVGKDFILLPTPTVSSAKGPPSNRFFQSEFYKSNLSEYIRDGKQDGIYPNPELIEALMTFPISWTEMKDSATQLCLL